MSTEASIEVARGETEITMMTNITVVQDTLEDTRDQAVREAENDTIEIGIDTIAIVTETETMIKMITPGSERGVTETGTVRATGIGRMVVIETAVAALASNVIRLCFHPNLIINFLLSLLIIVICRRIVTKVMSLMLILTL